MNPKTLAVIAAVAVTTSFASLAMANGKRPADMQTSGLMRAEVIAEIRKARASGTLNPHPDDGRIS